MMPDQCSCLRRIALKKAKRFRPTRILRHLTRFSMSRCHHLRKRPTLSHNNNGPTTTTEASRRTTTETEAEEPSLQPMGSSVLEQWLPLLASTAKQSVGSTDAATILASRSSRTTTLNASASSPCSDFHSTG